MTRSRLVGPELQILRPRDIITFRHVPLPAVEGATIHVVNDPAWIKRGMGGATKKAPWQATMASLPADVADRIEGWVRQMATAYRSEKRLAATRLYLAKYYCEFAAAVAGRR